jgi:SAM-dependent methyltransferase
MNKTDTWNSSDPYEYFMGRWSKQMAPVFLDWLNFPPGKSWLDIGCGTGALSEAIYLNCSPARLSCVDPSFAFLQKARQRLPALTDLAVGVAANIPKENSSFDIVVSGLALNFFPNLDIALSEMKRVLKTGGTVAAYVWDYSGRMDLLRIFWDAAIRVDPGAAKFDEGPRFPVCNGGNLKNIFENAGFSDVETAELDMITVFKDLNDYWDPFLGGQGPAPGYLASLNEQLKEKLKNNIRDNLPVSADGSIELLARAIAVRGTYKQ